MGMKARSAYIAASAVAIISAFLIGGCAGTFLVSKDCKSYFFGSGEEGLYRMLCETGDLRTILADTGLPDDLKERFYAAQCVDRSYDAVKALYATLAPEQRRLLKFSFQKRGYEINYKPIGNYRFNYGYSGPEFCPSETGY